MKKAIILVLCFLLALSIAGCKDQPEKGPADMTGGIISTSDYSVWSAYSTEKIMREEIDYAGKKAARLTMSGVKNEYESIQLVITAKQNIDSYNLIKSDLTDGKGNSISKENIEIYNEWYVFVDQPATYYPQGSYPDGLVPMDLAEKAGELKINENCNQGIWITVYIPDTPAGVYSGTFKLSVGGDSYDIPVELTVIDYYLPDASENTTLYVSRSNTLMQSELDCTVEMRRKIYEYFLDYRINLNALPIETLDVDEFVSVVKEYYNDERVNIYCLPAATTGDTFFKDFELWEAQILALAKESTPSLNLLSKAGVYWIDEPEGLNMIPDAVNDLRTWNAMIERIISKITEDTSGDYDEFKKIDGWQDTVRGIRNVVTCNVETTEVSDLCNVWCPGFGLFYTEYERNWKVERAEEKGAELWWYGCNGPRAPYPTLHIDDTLMSGRIVSWLQQAYNVKGQLYWSVTTGSNAYEDYWFSYTSGQKETVIANGDGYLVYPGAKYGYDGPLPSMRLMSVRDGYEEYELLMDIEHKYAEMVQEYGNDFDYKEAVSGIYSRLYTNMITTTDAELFDEVRTDLLSTVEEVFQPHGFLMEPAQIIRDTAYLTMYVRDGYTIKHNGQIVPGEGGKHTVTLDLNQNNFFVAEITDTEGNIYTISKYIGKPQNVLADFEAESALEGITASEGTVYELTENADFSVSGNSLYAKVPSRFIGDEYEDLFFSPFIQLSKSSFLMDVNFEDVSLLYMTLFNPTSSNAVINVSLVGSGGVEIELAKVEIEAFNSRQVSFDIENLDWSAKNTCTGIKFSMENVKNADGAALVYEFYVDEITCELKG